MSDPADIVILEPDAAARTSLQTILPARFRAAWPGSVSEAEALLDGGTARILICSDELGDESGLMFLARTRDRWPALKRVLMASDLDGDLFFHAAKEVSLFSYLSKPVARAEILRVLHHALGHESPPLEKPDGEARPARRPMKHAERLAVIAFCSLVVIALTVVMVAAFGILYELKSEMGVDLFPNWHMRDLFRSP